MSWLTDYCNNAEQTDRLAGRPNHVALLATGLFGETGSVLTELKKAQRETAAYPSYRNRLVEEIGDLLWYFARLVTVLAPSEVEKLSEALTLGGAAGALLATLQQKTDNVAASQLHVDRLQRSTPEAVEAQAVALELLLLPLSQPQDGVREGVVSDRIEALPQPVPCSGTGHHEVVLRVGCQRRVVEIDGILKR